MSACVVVLTLSLWPRVAACHEPKAQALEPETPLEPSREFGLAGQWVLRGAFSVETDEHYLALGVTYFFVDGWALGFQPAAYLGQEWLPRGMTYERTGRSLDVTLSHYAPILDAVGMWAQWSAGIEHREWSWTPAIAGSAASRLLQNYTVLEPLPASGRKELVVCTALYTPALLIPEAPVFIGIGPVLGLCGSVDIDDRWTDSMEMRLGLHTTLGAWL